MAQIKQDVRDERALLEKFGADPTFNAPDRYGVPESFYGEGKYPPDWAHRRNAIWWLQDDQCARCGHDAGTEGHVHHAKPLAAEGTNGLQNLVGLCADCHALLHPTVDDLNGDWRKAPKYPCENAQSEVAVIKRDRLDSGDAEQTGTDLDFEKIGAEVGPSADTYASQSPAVHDLPPAAVRRLSQGADTPDDATSVLEGVNERLLRRGRVPENESYDHRRIEIDTTVTGALGWLSSYEPDVSVTPTATTESADSSEATVEEVDRETAADTTIILSENVTEAAVSVLGGDGDVTRRRVTFTDETPARSASVSVSPPPLSASTVGSYARNFGQKTYLLSILYALLWLVAVPTAGLALLVSVFGMLAGALGVVGWAILALFFDGSWLTVGQMAASTLLSLVIASLSALVLEWFGIDLD
ncbi:HNH endonuclease [Halobellus sp. GM3]|uniref:HNH endonuclease n=1 Tax=Halobellus sp. GM3 TaxID=3458410 RepID=UPI00403DA925